MIWNSFFFFFSSRSQCFALTGNYAIYIQPVTFQNVFCPLGCHSFKLICLGLLWPLNIAAAFPPVGEIPFSSARRCRRPRERPSADRCFASISAEYRRVWSQIKCLRDSIATSLRGSARLRWVCPPQYSSDRISVQHPRVNVVRGPSQQHPRREDKNEAWCIRLPDCYVSNACMK